MVFGCVWGGGLVFAVGSCLPSLTLLVAVPLINNDKPSQFNDYHCCNDARSLVQTKKPETCLAMARKML